MSHDTLNGTATNHVSVEQHGNILRVALNRPEKKNALTHAMYTALADAIARVENEPGLRVLFITGTADCFTSGNDMVDFMHNPPTSAESPVSRFLGGLLTAKKPVVAAVNGPAVGVGTTMLLHCDLAYAGRSARFQMPFVSLGLCPEAGSSLLLPMMVGHRKAAQLLMLAEVFGADDARDYGFVNAVFDDADYQQKAWEKAEQLAAQPPASVRLAKAQMRASFPQLAEVMAKEAVEFMARLKSPEAMEAVGAFLQKKKPDFSRFS